MAGRTGGASRWRTIVVVILLVAAGVVFYLGWNGNKPSSGGDGQQPSSGASSQSQSMVVSVIGGDGQYLLKPMAIDERPLTKDANDNVNLHMDSSLPAVFLNGDSLGFPTEIDKKPVVMVAHTAAANVDEGYGPFTFMNDLPEGPQSGREIVRISGGALQKDIVCRVDNVFSGSSKLLDSVYLNVPPNTVTFITCFRMPSGEVDFSQGIRLTSTCLGA